MFASVLVVGQSKVMRLVYNSLAVLDWTFGSWMWNVHTISDISARSFERIQHGSIQMHMLTVLCCAEKGRPTLKPCERIQLDTEGRGLGSLRYSVLDR